MAGMGFSYGDLQLDILVSNTFWMTSPQMIFNDLYVRLVSALNGHILFKLNNKHNHEKPPFIVAFLMNYICVI
jgi:hypothetical protein